MVFMTVVLFITGVVFIIVVVLIMGVFIIAVFMRGPFALDFCVWLVMADTSLGASLSP